MTDALSRNTSAILLLTAPLIAGRSKRSPDLLKPSEYKKLALHLRELGGQPADLLAPDAAQLLGDCDRLIDKARMERLLARGFLLSQAVERWQTRAIWVISRADREYPQRLKTRLKEDSPALLYGCGELGIVGTGGLAVIGSRHVDDALVQYTQEIGDLTARAGRALVSGGARGIDQAAMRGALEAGGRVTGVLADSLERTSMNREHRNLLMEGQLVLISPYDPSAGFNVGHAMQRNKLIYALADAALAVSADLNKGGTWAGAVEQLEKLHLVPVYVRSTGAESRGLDGLKEKGALPWPNPEDAESLEVVLHAGVPIAQARPAQSELLFAGPQETSEPEPEPETDAEAKVEVAPVAASPETAKNAPQAMGASTIDAADELFRTVRALALRILEEPGTAVELASALGVSKPQSEKWLKRLVEEGVLEKRTKPVSYVAHQAPLTEDLEA
jgi:DNA processing protein